jgi:hypothetical protein
LLRSRGRDGSKEREQNRELITRKGGQYFVTIRAIRHAPIASSARTGTALASLGTTEPDGGSSAEAVA